jgi:hypothetical protein
LLAEMLEAAYLVTQLRQRLIVGIVEVLGHFENYIVARLVPPHIYRNTTLFRQARLMPLKILGRGFRAMPNWDNAGAAREGQSQGVK